MGAGNFVLQAFNRAVVGHLHQRIAKQPRRIIGAVQPELNRFAVQFWLNSPNKAAAFGYDS